MSITKNTSYSAEGLARLLEQYQNQPRMMVVVNALAAEAQAVENAFWDVFVDRLLQNTPTGDVLDKIGEIVGQKRLTAQADNAYLTYITTRIKTNRSTGKREELIAITALLIPAVTILVKDLPPATVEVTPVDPITIDPYLVAYSFLQPAVSAGVNLFFIWTTNTVASTLRCGYSLGGITQPTLAQSPGYQGDGSVSSNGAHLAGAIGVATVPITVSMT